MKSNCPSDLAHNRISPYYLFSEAATIIVNPNVRSILWPRRSVPDVCNGFVNFHFEP